MLGLNANTLDIEGEPLASLLDKPRQVLQQIKEALVAQDYVLLADILQYELGDVSEQWRTITAYLRDAVEEPQGAAPDAN